MNVKTRRALIVWYLFFLLHHTVQHSFYYQVVSSTSARDILLITLNHMDAVRKYVEGNDNILDLVNNVYKLLYQVLVNSTSIK